MKHTATAAAALALLWVTLSWFEIIAQAPHEREPLSPYNVFEIIMED